jgi:hypothetical protein
MGIIERVLNVTYDYRVESYYIQASNSSGIIGLAFQNFILLASKSVIGLCRKPKLSVFNHEAHEGHEKGF